MTPVSSAYMMSFGNPRRVGAQSRWNYRTPLLFLVSLFFFDIVLARNSEIQGKTGACRLDDYPCLFGAGNGRGL
jgi:hypothetical protein